MMWHRRGRVASPSSSLPVPSGPGLPSFDRSRPGPPLSGEALSARRIATAHAGCLRCSNCGRFVAEDAIYCAFGGSYHPWHEDRSLPCGPVRLVSSQAPTRHQRRTSEALIRSIWALISLIRALYVYTCGVRHAPWSPSCDAKLPSLPIGKRAVTAFVVYNPNVYNPNVYNPNVYNPNVYGTLRNRGLA